MRMLALVLVFAFACKSGPESSPDYSQAKQLFDAAYAEKEDDCFDDPRVKQAEAALRKVPEESLDFQAAVSLLDKIKEGRADLVARRAEEIAEARAKEAAKPPAEEPAFPSGGDVPLAAPEGEEVATNASPLPVGATIDQFQAKYADCVEKKMPFQESGENGKKGDAWGTTVGKETGCEKKFPELHGNLWLFADGKLLRPAPTKDSKVVTVTEKKEAPAQ